MSFQLFRDQITQRLHIYAKLQCILRHEHKLHAMLRSKLLLSVVVPLVSLSQLLALLQLLSSDLMSVSGIRAVCETSPASICPKFLMVSEFDM